MTITTGWLTPPPAMAGSVGAPQQVSAPVVTPAENWRPALTALETDLRRELQMMRSTSAAAVPVRSEPASADMAAVVRRVQALIAESEHRQRQELAMRLVQLDRDVDLRRRGDLVKIDQMFGQVQGRTGEVAETQREMYNLLRRVNTQVP